MEILQDQEQTKMDPNHGNQLKSLTQLELKPIWAKIRQNTVKNAFTDHWEVNKKKETTLLSPLTVDSSLSLSEESQSNPPVRIRAYSHK